MNEQQRTLPLTDKQSVEIVRIAYWQQDTMESGHWEKTIEMPRHIAEKRLSHFDQAFIITDAPVQGDKHED
jgi:hypothetical protein